MDIPNLRPMPGIIIAEEIQESGKLTLSGKSTTRILKARVVAVGVDLITPMGTLIKAKNYARPGEIIYFLSYEGNYDNAIIGNTTYYFIKFEDIRSSYVA